MPNQYSSGVVYCFRNPFQQKEENHIIIECLEVIETGSTAVAPLVFFKSCNINNWLGTIAFEMVIVYN